MFGRDLLLPQTEPGEAERVTVTKSENSLLKDRWINCRNNQKNPYGLAEQTWRLPNGKPPQDATGEKI